MLARVSQNSILIYKIHSHKTKNKSESSLKNLKDNKTKTYSRKAQKRTKLAVSALINAETIGKFGLDWKKKKKQVQLSFITLTLPTKQMHTDKELKRMLNSFIILLQNREKNKFAFVWKAERQKNGNLHFHLLINKKVYHTKIRLVWNFILKEMGYIEKYKEKFAKISKKEYIELRKKYNLKNNKSWNEREQKKAEKAFYFGVKTNWEDPNTTDVCEIKKIANVEAYICKYMQKESDVIEGRYWGCSDNIKDIQYNTFLTNKDCEILRANASFQYESDYFTYYQIETGLLKYFSFFFNFIVFWQNIYCALHNLEFSNEYKFVFNDVFI